MDVKVIKTNGDLDLTSIQFKALGEKEQANQILETLILMCGHFAGKCYTADNYETIKNEPIEKTKSRINFCIKKQHHSVLDHATITFEMDNVAKAIFMLLNNENVYTTSEQSARYTDFSKAAETAIERELYVKWQQKLNPIILKEYPKLTEAEAAKLAQENARYMISVFVPSSMIHTLSLRQLNYIIRYIEDFLGRKWCRNDKEKDYAEKMDKPLREFLEKISLYRIEGLEPKQIKSLSMFKDVPCFGETNNYSYELRYKLSFAAHAQNHRHRTIRYKAKIPSNPNFFVPPIIEENSEIKKEWLEDMKKVEGIFPQGMIIEVVETGIIDDFIEKCEERLCARAQLEIMRVTVSNYKKLLASISVIDIKNYITDVIGSGEKTARCQFKGYKCTDTCKFGANQITRKI